MLEVRVVASAIAALWAAAVTVPQQPAFRAKTQTVSVYATVRDDNSRLLPDLQRDDFQVLEDGRPTEITVFSNDPQPIIVAVMIDTGGGMHLGTYSPTNRIGRFREAAMHFVKALRPIDRAVIGSFGYTEVATSPVPTSDQAVLERILKEELWPIGGPSPVWQGVDAGMSSLATETGRRVVLLITAGVASPARFVPGWLGTHSQVHERAVREDFMVYAIGFEQTGLAGEVTLLADATGGGHFQVSNDADLASIFVRVAEELRHQYALGFSPRVLDGKTHRIDVRVNLPGAKVRARKSYVARVDR
jgi:Ca-activated chloride channel homolog